MKKSQAQILYRSHLLTHVQVIRQSPTNKPAVKNINILLYDTDNQVRERCICLYNISTSVSQHFKLNMLFSHQPNIEKN